MKTPPLVSFSLVLALALASTGRVSAGEGILLDDFNAYQPGEAVTTPGADGVWRSRGVQAANAGRVIASADGGALALGTRQFALFDAPRRFAIDPDRAGAISFRIRMPAGDATHDQGFMFIVKTRGQAEADLTAPANGLMLLHISFDAGSSAYRLRLEGPGPSPTRGLIAPGQWYRVIVSLDLARALYQVRLAADGDEEAAVVTNHRFRNGLIPFKNQGTSAAEVIYLRNHNLAGQVELDDLRFIDEAGLAITGNGL